MLHTDFSSGTDTRERLIGAVSKDSLLTSTIEQDVNVCMTTFFCSTVTKWIKFEGTAAEARSITV